MSLENDPITFAGLEKRQNDEAITTSDLSYTPNIFMSLEKIKELDEKYLLQNYAKMPVAFQYGSGEYLYDIEGKKYIDFLSGIAVTGLGHAHADLISTLQTQADALWHTSNLFFNAQQAQLGRALVELSIPGKVFFCNSGTEANEAALKLMRAFGQKFRSNKTKIISLRGGFHGRSFGSMSMTGQEKIHDGFGDILGDMVYVDPNDEDQIMAAFDENVCGMIIEPVIGEGGVLPIEGKYMQLVRDLCNEFESLMVVDEIQIGMGRSGKYFAYQNYDIKPDAITLAKALGGGFPIGALIIAEQYATVLKPGTHGSTFGGNHLACAVAYEVIRTIESNDILDNVKKMGDYLFTKLILLQKKHPTRIHKIRGMGLLIGVVLNEKVLARPLITKGLAKGLIFGRASDNVIRLAPPLILRQSVADKAIDILDEIIAEI